MIGQAGRFIGQQAVQLHGGMGMTDELIVSHWFKRLTAAEFMFGDSDTHLQRYAALSRPDGLAGHVTKRVLLCYDGSTAGRRALRRGAELAVLLNAQVYVLSIIPEGLVDPVVLAGASGHACLVDNDHGFRKMLDESVRWLTERGVAAEGFLAAR